jgi:hypothetical protein
MAVCQAQKSAPKTTRDVDKSQKRKGDGQLANPLFKDKNIKV